MIRGSNVSVTCPKVALVMVWFSRHEVCVIEHIKELCAEFNVGAFRNPGPLDHAEIEIPVAGPTHWSEVQCASRVRSRMAKERRICTPVGTNQPGIHDQWTTGYRNEESTHAALQLLETQSRCRGVLAGSSVPVEGATS